MRKMTGSHAAKVLCTLLAATGVLITSFVWLYFVIVVVILLGHVVGLDMSKQTHTNAITFVLILASVITCIYWRYAVVNEVSYRFLIVSVLVSFCMTIPAVWPIIERTLGRWFDAFIRLLAV